MNSTINNSSSNISRTSDVHNLEKLSRTEAQEAVQEAIDSEHQMQEDMENVPSFSYTRKTKRQASDKADILRAQKDKEALEKIKFSVTESDKNKDSSNKKEDSKSFLDQADKLLKKATKEKASDTKMIQMAGELSKDPYTVSRYLSYISKNAKVSNIQNSANKAFFNFAQKNKVFIVAGNNITEFVTKYKTLGDEEKLRVLYNENVMKNNITTNDVFKYVTKIFPKKEQQFTCIKFLLEAASFDLRDRNVPNAQRALLMHGIENAQSFLTIKNIFDNNKSFLVNALKNYNINEHPPTTDVVYKKFMQFITESRNNAVQLKKDIVLISPRGSLEIGFAISKMMVYVANQLPNSVFKIKPNSTEKAVLGNRNLFIQSLRQVELEFSTSIEKINTAKINAQLKELNESQK